jgi:peptide deformylase
MNSEIRIVGDPVLRQHAETVTRFDGELLQLVDDLEHSMRAAQGIGLAAPQIGVSLRVILVGHFDEDDSILMQPMINPRVIDSSGKCEMEEGCLSVPGVREVVIRPENVTVEFQDVDGKLQQRELTELEARVFLHEYDHLEGVLFVDRISPIRRGLIQNRLKKLAHDRIDHA